MKITFKIALIITFVLSQSCNSQDCPPGINDLPMYGEVEKCKEQLEADADYLAEMDDLFVSREAAADDVIKQAWHHFYKDDLKTAMRRFNQAWLLDRTNYHIYWGFGNILGKSGKPKQAIKMFDLGKQYNPTESDFYVASASAYGDVFQKTEDKSQLHKAIKDLEIAVKLDQNNVEAFVVMTKIYAALNLKSKAIESMKKAEKIDPNSIDPLLKKFLTTP